ncbi:MAG: transcriptional repressor [Desulfovibrio sp.]|nr:transcriptional repressor [Desulfovibrio sp.]
MLQTRMTKQRAAILEILRSVQSHPTADELYEMVRKKLPRISLGTVYRNLEFLNNAGELVRLERAGMQKRFDGNITPHHHVRCKRCGRIGDVFFPSDRSFICDAQTQDFIIHDMDVEFTGLCRLCEAQMPDCLELAE